MGAVSTHADEWDEGWENDEQIVFKTSLTAGNQVTVRANGNGLVFVGADVTQQLPTDDEDINEYVLTLKKQTVTVAGNVTDFNCDGNKITELDVSKNLSLLNLSCAKNNIKSVDLSKHDKLEVFTCWGNAMRQTDLDRQIQLLPMHDVGDNEEGGLSWGYSPQDDRRELKIYNPRADESIRNYLTIAQVNNITKQGWCAKEMNFQYGARDPEVKEVTAWQEYFGQSSDYEHHVANGIAQVTNERMVRDECWYDLNGRRLDRPTRKGIYIHHGKKVMMR